VRPASMCVGTSCGGSPATITPIDPPTTTTSDEPPTLTEKEISDVIQRAKHRLTECYQREVNRDPSLAGTVHVRFEIAADGRVTASRVTGSTVRSDAVNDCLARTVTSLHFPARGRAVVNYPFVFAID
jgi:TonB family protein